MAIEVKVAGLAELAKALEALPKVLRNRYLGAATVSGLAPMRDLAKQLAPVLKTPDGRRIPGALRDAIILLRDRNPSDHSVRYFVTIRKIKLNRAEKKVLRILAKAGKTVNILEDAYYGRFDEFGTSKMAAQPFMRPAFEQEKAGAVDRFSNTLRDKLPDAVNEAKL